MKLLAETHTHTIACSHAYNSISEMLERAKQLGLELIAITDHAPSIPDAPHEYHFLNLKALPRKIDGIYVLQGAEVNIIDSEGNLDLPEMVLARLDLVITSFHEAALSEEISEDYTEAYINVLKNPYVDIIGHCGTPEFPFDIDKVLNEAKKQDKIIEINNHSFATRKGSLENCLKIAKRCAELGVKIVISTDAHSIYEMARTEVAQELVKRAGVSEDLIMNLTAEKFISYLCKRKGFKRSRFESEEPFGLPTLDVFNK
ncbi:MAG: phosphatase [Clostridia bacterium]|nr:phosphatase [Clostridia bacterium]